MRQDCTKRCVVYETRCLNCEEEERRKIEEEECEEEKRRLEALGFINILVKLPEVFTNVD